MRTYAKPRASRRATPVVRPFAVALGLALLAAAAVLLAARHAAAATDIKLDKFKVVIGDDGKHRADWDRDPARVVLTLNGTDHKTHKMYFTDIPSEYYVVQQEYPNPDYVTFQVADEQGRLIDARQAYYVWDDSRYGRGGTPLVLAFRNQSAAESYAKSHPGAVVSYTDLTGKLQTWRTDNDSDIYWRGHDHWTDSSWNRAWNDRWGGWSYDRDHGWRHEEHHGKSSRHHSKSHHR
jgi:hypothetical protein